MTGFAAGAADASCADAASPVCISAPGGFASSSAMMRRIDAKISSIEGSWTFAGCVISDSTSSAPSFTPSASAFAGSGYAGRDFHRTSLTCPQIERRGTQCKGSRPCSGHRSITTRRCKMRGESPCSLRKRYVMAIIDCKQRAGFRTNWNSFRPASQDDAAINGDAVGRANADPCVTDLMIMHARVINGGRQVEHDRRQSPYRVQGRHRMRPRGRAGRSPAPRGR